MYKHTDYITLFCSVIITQGWGWGEAQNSPTPNSIMLRIVTVTPIIAL